MPPTDPPDPADLAAPDTRTSIPGSGFPTPPGASPGRSVATCEQASVRP